MSVLKNVVFFICLSIPLKSEEVSKENFVFPFFEKNKEALLEVNRQLGGDLVEYFTRAGVFFTEGSSIFLDIDKNLLNVNTDHENGLRIMLIITQMSNQSFNMIVYGFEDPLGSPEIDLSSIKNPVIKGPVIKGPVAKEKEQVRPAKRMNPRASH